METTFDRAEPADLSTSSSASASFRVTSIDAVRGLVMFTMIFVNDIAGVSQDIVPAWMRHHRGPDGMTFVDLVFPAFLFIVGMSIPFALGARMTRGEPRWKCLGHILGRTLALLSLGVLMVNGLPDSSRMGWSATLWSALLLASLTLWLGSISPTRKAGLSAERKRVFRLLGAVLHAAGFAGLVWLAFAWRGHDGQRIITLFPFSLHSQWWGILGLIGWAYLVSAVVFLLFRNRSVALLGCMALLMCLYPASRSGAFDHFTFARYVSIGEALGSHAAISVAGMLLASVLLAPDLRDNRSPIRFTLLFVAGCSAGALLLDGLYGISKNAATPSWCLWACAITAAIWLIVHLLSETGIGNRLAGPFAVAGRNVLLAYLLSNLLGPALDLLRLGDWYSRLAGPDLANAVARSAGTAVVVLSLSVAINRLGFRLKL
jgi:predicted acyltransferase